MESNIRNCTGAKDRGFCMGAMASDFKIANLANENDVIGLIMPTVESLPSIAQSIIC